MKKMKKIVSLMIVLAMVLSVMCPVFAADEEKGKITVQNAVNGQTYSAYKIFDLESYSKGDDDLEGADPNREDWKYSYYIDLANSPWAGFFPQRTEGMTDAQWEALDKKGSKYVDIDENGLVTAKEGFKDWSNMAKEFAKEALAYAKANNITPADSETASGSSVVFDDLDLGYYLIDSSVGTLCDLTTTDNDAIVEDKNLEPVITNKVKHESDTEYVEEVSGETGETLDFEATITGKEGAENYKLTIDLEPGLDYVEGSPVLKYRDTVYQTDANGNYVLDNNGNQIVTSSELKTLPTTAYTLTETSNGFVVEFDQDFLDTLKDNQSITTVSDGEEDDEDAEFQRDNIDSDYAPYIVVDYKATLKEDGNAEIYGDVESATDETSSVDEDNNENISYAQLEFAENNNLHEPELLSTSAKDPATVVTYFVDIVKTDNSDITEKGYAEILKSAKFVLHRTQNGTDEIVKLKEVTGANGAADRTVYRVTNANGGLAEFVLADVARIEGLRGGIPDDVDNSDTNKWTYYLEEVEAPEGYNLLPARIPVTVLEANQPATITRNTTNADTDNDGKTDPDKYTTGGIRVINKTGTVLPRTGGIGTTILYIVGGLLMIGAGVVLVAKKKTGSK